MRFIGLYLAIASAIHIAVFVIFGLRTSLIVWGCSALLALVLFLLKDRI